MPSRHAVPVRLLTTLFALFCCSFAGCSEEDGNPSCDGVPSAIEFGQPFFAGPAVPFSVTREFVVMNNGTGDLEIRAEIEVMPPIGWTPGARLAQFHLDSSTPSTGFVIRPGESRTIELLLTADSNVMGGAYTGTLRLGLPCDPISFSADITIGE